MAGYAAEEETLDPVALDRLQRGKLTVLLAETARSNTFYQRKFSDVAFDPATDPLDCLPFTTRAEIQQDQRDHPPYGSGLTYSIARYTRLHQTSGTTGTPLRWLDTPESWAWWIKCWSTVFRAASLTAEDRVMAPFSFGPFIGFWAAFEAAVSLDAMVLAGGGMTTAARLAHILDHEVTAICCTPTYALRMLEVAAEDGLDVASSAVRLLIVAGEPGGHIPAVRSRIESGWGARVYDHAGMTELGAWGFECTEAPGGVHVIENEFIAEVVDPDSGGSVPEGELGELVLTNLGRLGSPLIRYRTGDLVRLGRGQCACGRWFTRLEAGVVGRRDDMLVVRGNNVFPSAIEGILREIPGLVEFRLTVVRTGSLADLRIEVEPQPEAGSRPTGGRSSLAKQVEDLVRNRLHFRPRVEMVEPGTLPRFEMKARRVVRIDEQEHQA